MSDSADALLCLGGLGPVELLSCVSARFGECCGAMDGLKLCTFSTDASWHSVCVILIVAVQLASNISLESAIDQGNPKSKLLRLAVPVELTNCPKTVC
jgi:hypothetical protein